MTKFTETCPHCNKDFQVTGLGSVETDDYEMWCPRCAKKASYLTYKLVWIRDEYSGMNYTKLVKKDYPGPHHAFEYYR